MNIPKNFTDEELIAEVVGRCQLGDQFRLELERVLERDGVVIVSSQEDNEDL